MTLHNSMFAWLLLISVHALQQQLLLCLCEGSISAIIGLIAGASALNGSRCEMSEGQHCYNRRNLMVTHKIFNVVAKSTLQNKCIIAFEGHAACICTFCF